MGRKTRASAVQQQFWLLHQLNPNSPAYNIGSVFRLRGNLRVDRLETSVNILYRDYAVIRSTFALEGDELFQIEHPYRPIQIAMENVEHGKDNTKEAQRIIKDEVARCFDLEKGPLARFKLLNFGGKEHVFIITMHHIITDLRSKEVLGERLSFLYNSGPGGEAPADESESYARFSQWQREWLSSSDFQDKLAFWRQHLAGRGGLLAMPADRPRNPLRALRGSAVGLDIPPALFEGLKRFCRERSLNAFLVLLSVYIGVLNRYSGQETIVVGVPFTNRRREEYKDAVGCFVNAVPIAAGVNESTTFMELLAITRKAMLEAHRRQEVPLEAIVKAMGIPRDPSFNPVYQAGFTFEHPMTMTLSGLAVEPVYIHHGGAQLDLFATFWEATDALRGFLEYDSDLFDAETARRISANFIVLLEAAISDPLERVCRLSLLTKNERSLVVHEWNDTARDYPKDLCLPDFLVLQAAKTPDAIAVTFEGHGLSYSELDSRTNRLGAYLRSVGVKPDSLVVVFMERSIEMVIALWGIAKSGGAYMPIDPDDPAARVETMIRNAGPVIILTQENLTGRLPVGGIPALALDAQWDIVAGESDGALEKTVTSQNLSYVINTSGSTGVPKGAMNTHGGICNSILWMQETYRLTEHDRYLQKTPYSFDVSVWEFFWPHMVGARLVVAPPKSHKDPSALVQLINEQAITTIHLAPSMLQAFLHEPACSSCTSLKRVFCIGEALSPEVQDRFFETFNAQLHNLYGPAEAAVAVSYWDCRNSKGTGKVPIGRPVANTQLYVLDGQRQPAPIGVSGELYIGGIQVGRGYLNSPQLTQRSFLDDAFGSTAGGKIYKTGDIALFQSDGSLLFMGRVDYQVKIRGNRVEPGEIEKILLKHPRVREAVVVADGEMSANRRLVAYFVPTAGEHVPVAALRRFLKERLPDYMVPSVFIALDAFPQTTSGKIDRKALPKPDQSHFETEANYSVPTSETEKRLAELWRRVLGIERIGVLDDFFTLGGDSLMSVQLAQLVAAAFQTKFSTVKVFQYSTMSAMARFLESDGEDKKPAFEAIEERTRLRRASQARRGHGVPKSKDPE